MSPPAQKALPLLLRITTASTPASSRHASKAVARARTIASDSELSALGRSRIIWPVRLPTLVWMYSLMAMQSRLEKKRAFYLTRLRYHLRARCEVSSTHYPLNPATARVKLADTRPSGHTPVLTSAQIKECHDHLASRRELCRHRRRRAQDRGRGASHAGADVAPGRRHQRRPGLLQVREFPARGRVQVPRRVQRHQLPVR